MKQQYVAAQMDLINFPLCDVITTSTIDFPSTDTEPTKFGWPIRGTGSDGDEWL